MEGVQVDYQIHDYDNYDEQVSDSESCISDDKIEEGLFGDEMVRLDESVAIFDVIGQKFMSNLARRKKNCRAIIEAIHRMNWSHSRTMKARVMCFNIFRETMSKNNDNINNNNYYGDDVNNININININNNNYYGDDVGGCMKYAWYCGSKEEIQRIVSHGFGHRQLGNCRHGICLTPLNSLAQSVGNCVVDDEGLRHVLICQVLLENGQSLKELNSNVVEHEDDIISPSQYIVWSTKMNTHILPEYVVSFRTFPSLEGIPKAAHQEKKPPAISPWLPFKSLISALCMYLPPPTTNLIIEHYTKFKKGKISRRDFIDELAQYVGRDFLINLVKRYGTNNQVNEKFHLIPKSGM